MSVQAVPAGLSAVAFAAKAEGGFCDSSRRHPDTHPRLCPMPCLASGLMRTAHAVKPLLIRQPVLGGNHRFDRFIISTMR